MVKAPTPSLVKIKQSASETEARALLYIALCELCDFFNVGKNMSDTQIAVTVDLILDTYGYMKLEEIKYCFRRAMSREQLFDRLDGNIIMGWLDAYDAERTEAAMTASHNEAVRQMNTPPADGAITWEAHVNNLWDLAIYADAEAVELLSDLQEQARRAKPRTREQEHDNARDFMQYYYTKYLKGII